MALTQVTGPYPIFTDLDGSPLDDGYLYIGAANQDPETNPIQVFWDSALTITATQPIRTNNGYAWRNGTPGLLYTAGEFSITIRNKRNEFVLYSPLGYGFDPKAVSASVVKNDFTGNGVETDFTLSASPSTILATNVFINGVYQEKDSYSLNGNVITFSAAPPLGSSIEVMTNETGVINSGNATAISYTASFPGAVAQTVQTKLEQYVSVKDFGAVDDGVTDNTTAIQAAAAHIQAQGGGTLAFPFTDTGEYRVEPALGSVIADFTDLDGVQILFEGTTLKDTQSYPSLNNEATAFRFTRCNNVRVNANVTSQSIVSAGVLPVIKGLIAVKLVDVCTNFDLNVSMAGGRNAVWVSADPALSQNSASLGRVTVKANNVLYPYAGTYSGDQVHVDIDADTCGRNFFIYGVYSNWITVKSKDQQITSLLSCGGGSYIVGCRDISVDFYDRDSTVGLAAPLVEMVFNTSPVTYQNIHFNFDVYCPAGQPFNTTFRFVKTDGSTGHVVDGFSITGRSEHSNGLANAHIATGGTFVAPDVFRNVNIHDFYCTGNNTFFGFPVQVMDGPTAIFQNVVCETIMNLGNGSVGNPLLISCKTPYADSGSNRHTYVNCEFTSSSQSTTNKTIINSSINGTYVSRLASLERTGTWTPADTSGAGLTLGVTTASYSRIGNVVFAAFDVTYPVTADASSACVSLPFTPVSGTGSLTVGFNQATVAFSGNTNASVGVILYASTNGANVTNAQLSNNRFAASVTYITNAP